MSLLEILTIYGLAILQGLTEFLPVSSSGHLLLMQHFGGFMGKPGPILELTLHGGTLLSILVFYRKRLLALLNGVLRREKASLMYCAALVLSCIPAGVVYFLFQEPLDNLFDQPLICSLMLMVTGLLLLSTRFLPRTNRDSALGFLSVTGIGLIQAVALLPGISRSGSTITCARWFGIAPQKAAEFSFLMSIPLLAGAILLKAKDIYGFVDSPRDLALMLTGCGLAAIIGFLALKILALFQLSGKFWYFGAYCLLAGGAAALFILMG